MVGIGRQRIRQIAVCFAITEGRNPVASPPLFVRYEPPGGIDRAKTVCWIKGRIESQAIHVLDIAIDSVARRVLRQEPALLDRTGVFAHRRAKNRGPWMPGAGDVHTVT